MSLPTKTIINGILYVVIHQCETIYFAKAIKKNGQLHGYQVGSVINSENPITGKQTQELCTPQLNKVWDKFKCKTYGPKQKQKAQTQYNEWAKFNPDYQPIQ